MYDWKLITDVNFIKCVIIYKFAFFFKDQTSPKYERLIQWCLKWEKNILYIMVDHCRRVTTHMGQRVSAQNGGHVIKLIIDGTYGAVIVMREIKKVNGKWRQ